MKKAILVGNGFSSQILSELKSNVIKLFVHCFRR